MFLFIVTITFFGMLNKCPGHRLAWPYMQKSTAHNSFILLNQHVIGRWCHIAISNYMFIHACFLFMCILWLRVLLIIKGFKCEPFKNNMSLNLTILKRSFHRQKTEYMGHRWYLLSSSNQIIFIHMSRKLTFESYV